MHLGTHHFIQRDIQHKAVFKSLGCFAQFQSVTGSPPMCMKMKMKCWNRCLSLSKAFISRRRLDYSSNMHVVLLCDRKFQFHQQKRDIIHTSILVDALAWRCHVPCVSFFNRKVSTGLKQPLALCIMSEHLTPHLYLSPSTPTLRGCAYVCSAILDPGIEAKSVVRRSSFSWFAWPRSNVWLKRKIA